MNLALSYPLLPPSTVDDVINAVIAQTDEQPEPANEEPAETEHIADSSEDDLHKLYCLCNKVSSGEMIACDNLECPKEWFHFQCVSITRAPRGKWFCQSCRSEAGTKRKLNFEETNDEPKKRRVEKSKCPQCGNMLTTSYIKTHLKKSCPGNK